MFIFLFSWLLSANAAKAPCAPELSFGQAMLVHATGAADLERVQRRMLDDLAYFKIWGGRPWRQVCGDQTSPVSQLYSMILNARARGLHDHAEHGVQVLIEVIRDVLGKSFDIGTFRRQLNEVSDRPEVDRESGFALPILKLRAVPEQIFAQFSAELMNVDRQMVTGPHQAEIVRLIHQFGHREPGERLLYMGEGAPAVLLTSAYYHGATSYFGVDPQTPTERTRAFLKKIDATITTAPFDPHFLTKAAPGVPYQVVAAVDVITKNPLRSSVNGRRGADAARALRDLLAPSGVLILLNDFGDPPPFSREEAVQSGFEVVRWGADRRLPKGLIPYVYPAGMKKAGELRAFVLRNGPERIPRGMSALTIDPETSARN